MPLAATASVSPVCCVVCLSFWPVFRSLPVCWSAFILAFFSYSSCQLILKPYFLPVFSPLYFPFLSYLCHSLFTTNFISLFPLVLLSYLSHSSAPPLQFSFLSPLSLPPSSSLWHLVFRCCWGTVDCSTVCCRAVPGALGGSVCLCASGNVFFKPAAPVKNMYCCFWFRHPCTYCTHFSEPVLVKNSIKRAEGGWCGFTVTYWF